MVVAVSGSVSVNGSWLVFVVMDNVSGDIHERNFQLS